MQPADLNASPERVKAAAAINTPISAPKEKQNSEIVEKVKESAHPIISAIQTTSSKETVEAGPKIKEEASQALNKNSSELTTLVNDVGKMLVQNIKKEALEEVTKDRYSYSEVISRYKLHGPEHEQTRLDIAKIFFSELVEPNTFAVKDFDLSDPKKLAELAKFIVESFNTDAFFSNSESFKMEEMDETVRYELAKLVCSCGPEKLVRAESLKVFRITNDSQLAEIVSLLTEYHSTMEVEYRPTIEDFLAYVNYYREDNSVLNSKLIKDKIDIILDPDIKEKSIKIVETFNHQFRKARLPQNQKANYLPYLREILAFEEPEMRNKLVPFLITFGPPQTGKLDKPTPADSLLFHMFVGGFKQNSKLSEKQWDSIKTVLNDVAFADFTKKASVIKAFQNYWSSLPTDTTFEIIDTVLLKIFCPIDVKKNEIVQRVPEQLQMMQTILELNGVDALKKLILPVANESQEKTKESSSLTFRDTLKSVVTNIFKDSLKLSGIEGFQKKFSEHVIVGRQPNALITYAGQLQTLTTNKEKAWEVFTKFITSILENTYKAMRYAGTENSHLAKIFSAKGCENLQKEWMAGKSCKMEDLVKFEDSSSKRITDKLVQAASKNLDAKTYGELAQLAEQYKTPEEIAKAKDGLNTWFQSHIPAKGSKFDIGNETNRLYFQNKMEYALLSLLASKTPLEQAKNLEGCLALISKNGIITKDIPKFTKDVNELKMMLQKAMSKTLIVERTDNWQDMLLIGTEVPTCQAVGGNVEYNKCLLSYLTDGKNQAITIKKEGKIIARCMLRLMWDDVKKCPVLAQEKIYPPEAATSHYSEALDNMAIQTAKELGLSLVKCFSKKEMNKDPLLKPSPAQDYSSDLVSLNSTAPYEYVDALADAHEGASPAITNGTFTIPKSCLKKVYMHP